jgi:hypothetical protein
VWDPGYRCLIVGRDQIDALAPNLLAALQTGDQRPDFEAIRHGNRVFILADHDGCVHRGYVRLTEPGSHDRKAVFFEGLGTLPEIRSCETSARARGRGIYRRMINEQLRFLQSLGYRRAVMYIMAENAPSIKAATAAGYQLYRTLNDWVIFNLVVVQQVREPAQVRWRVFVQ